MESKIIGYLLIVVGILVIFLTAVSVYVGFRIASLGTMLARPIVVDLQAKGLPKKESQKK